MQSLISLLSDTETRPGAAMRQAIANAEVGDEQRGEDPSVNRLQARVAEMLGKEAALWFPGGTMCNFVAIRVHTRPADALVCDAMAHIVRAESGGVAVSAGVMLEQITTERGIFTPDQLDAALVRLATAGSPYGPPTKLVCVEQTHNFGGGSVWSEAELGAVSLHARSKGLALHMDGARLMNACIASGVAPAAFARHVDSLWLDFTKGLGAPIGAVLAGSRDFIAEARRQKHIFAGAMRQAGIAAAACLYALDHNIDRLADDHAHARKLARGLAQIEGLRVRNLDPESNMVFFDPSGTGLDNGAFLARLQAHGVRMGEVRGQIRAVTHLDVSNDDIDTALAALQAVAGNAGRHGGAPITTTASSTGGY